MNFELKHIDYDSLNPKQKENFNFQKISGVLADYGFSTIRLTQDWQGADFIAQHLDGVTFFPVQLKGRLAFRKSYMQKNLWICFRDKQDFYFFPHDKVLELVLKSKVGIKETDSWRYKGKYGWPQLPVWAKPLLQQYKLNAKKKSEANEDLAFRLK